MTDDDIYGNKERYERFLRTLDDRTLPEEQWQQKCSRRHRYKIKNPVNIKYFHQLVPIFEANDLSYIHRLRQFQHLILAAHICEKDFADCKRDDINEIVAYMHTRYKSAKSKHDFIIYIRRVWKLVFPDRDEKGHVDDTVIPYVVRHLSPKIDKSKLRMRNDRLTWEEFESILNFFGNDVRLQAYIMLATESLGRPQEILSRKIKHVELYDCYARVWLTEHGKEGPGLLQCIDSFPYLAKWLNEHPRKKDPEAFLFINLNSWIGKQMTPFNVNKHLKRACAQLGIRKNITCYSLKRNGVTFRRLRGESDLEIQHAARWTSMRQLKVYDLSGQEDAFQRQLMKRGIVKPDEMNKHLQPETKNCIYCGEICGFTDDICGKCKRPLDRENIVANIREDEQFKEDFEMMRSVLERLKDHLPAHIMEGLTSPEMKGGG